MTCTNPTKAGIACLVALAWACAKPPTVVTVKGGVTGASPDVLVLKSQTAGQLATRALKTFMRKYNGSVAVMEINPGVSEELAAQEVLRLRPKAVVTLGAPATALATARIHDIPVLFALVLHHERLHTQEAANMMGIAMKVAPMSELTGFKMVLPNLRRVLVPYTPSVSADLVRQAQQAAQELGIELIALPVVAPMTPRQLYEAHRDVDAVWLIADPVINDFDGLKEICANEHKALVTSLSASFARAGALMSASVNIESLGAQAATLVRMVTERGAKPADVGVQQPIGVNFVVNTDVARALGVDIPPYSLPYIRLVETQGKAPQK